MKLDRSSPSRVCIRGHRTNEPCDRDEERRSAQQSLTWTRINVIKSWNKIITLHIPYNVARYKQTRYISNLILKGRIYRILDILNMINLSRNIKRNKYGALLCTCTFV